MAKSLPYTNPDYVLELTGETVNLTHCDYATSIINQHMGSGRSVFQNGTRTLRLSGDGSQWLDLGYYPITGVASVNYIDPQDVTTSVASSVYMTPAQHGEADGYLYNSAGWASGQGNIQVTFTYGANGDMMELVRSVASWISAYIKREGTVSNVRSETIGAYSVQYIQDNKARSAIDTQLELLPRHWNIGAVGQQPDSSGQNGLRRTMSEDDLYNSGWSNF
jgi:hypothetical protein